MKCDRANPALRRVLLLDGHAGVREGVANVLNGTHDLRVSSQADSAETALRELDVARPDIIVCDISLLGCGGFQLIEQLSAHPARVPVLALSIYSESFYGHKAFRAGAAGYVMKGDGQQLLAAIRKILDGGIQLSDHLRAEIIRHLQAERAPGSQPPFDRLTDLERVVLWLRGRRLDAPAIARERGAEEKPIRESLSEIRRKLRLANDVAVLHHAILWVETAGAAPA